MLNVLLLARSAERFPNSHSIHLVNDSDMSGSSDMRSPLEKRGDRIFEDEREFRTCIREQVTWIEERDAFILQIQREIDAEEANTADDFHGRCDLKDAQDDLLSLDDNLMQNVQKTKQEIERLNIRVPDLGRKTRRRDDLLSEVHEALVGFSNRGNRVKFSARFPNLANAVNSLNIS